MERILNLLNLYPYQISFNHDKKNMFYSVYGMILSGISYIIIIFLIQYYSYDLFKKTNPKVKINQDHTDENLTLSINDILSSINLNVTIDFNSDEINLNPEIFLNQTFNFSISIINILGGKEKSEKYYSSNFKNISLNSIYSSEYNYSWTLSYQMTNETEFKYSYIDNSIEKYGNSSKKFKDINFTLKNSDIIIDFNFSKPQNMNNYSISSSSFYYENNDYTINIEDFYNYFLTFKKPWRIKTGECLVTRYRIIQLISDDNPFYTNYISSYIPQIDYVYLKTNRLNTYDDGSSYGKLMEIQFREVMHVYTRIYKKILDVLSELGGIFNPILIIGKFFVLKFNEKNFKIDILNQLFTKEDVHSKVSKEEKIINNEKPIIKSISPRKKSNFLKDKMNNINFQKEIFSIKYKTHEKQHFEIQNLSNTIKIEENEKIKNETSRCLMLRNIQSEIYSVKKVSNKDDFNYNLINKKNDLNLIHAINQNSIPNQIEIESKNESNKQIFERNNPLILQEQNTNKIIPLKNCERIIKNEINDYIISLKKKQNILLEYSFTNIIYSILCSRRIINKNLLDKEEIYNKVIEKVNFYFEITNLMKLYDKFEKMKFILFNRNQINCFDYMIHDVININNIKEEEILYDLSKYFENANKNHLENYIDQSIKLLLKSEIKFILKE